MTKITQYKNTPIGPIPTDWEVKKFSELFNVFPTASYSRADLTTDDDILYMHYGDIHTKYNYHLNLDNANLPTISIDKLKKYELVKEGDLIISDASEDYDGIGKAIEILNLGYRKMISGLHTFLAREREPFFAKMFKGYACLHLGVVKQFRKLATGTKVYSISKDSLLNIQIPLPPLAEQQKIAEILSTWDKAIQDTDAIIKKLEDRNKALSNKLISFKDLPKQKKIKEVVDRIKRAFIPIDEELYTQIGIRSHAKGLFYKEPVTGKELGNKSVFWIEPNCFIVNIVFAWEQAVAKTTDKEIGYIASHRFPMYNPKKGLLDLDYLLYLFKTPKGKDLLEFASPGGAGRNKTLGQSNFLDLNIPVPPIDEQKNIVKILNTANQELKQYQEKLEQLKQQKKGLMQQLLTGKVRTI